MNAREPDDLALLRAAHRRARSQAAHARESQLDEAAPRRAEKFDFKTAGEQYGLLVAWALLILLFGAFTPTMFTWPPYASMLGFNSIVVVLTLGLIIPLTAGDFDLSVASTLTLSAMLVAILNVKIGVPILVAGVSRVARRRSDRRHQRLLHPLFSHPFADRHARRRLFRQWRDPVDLEFGGGVRPVAVAAVSAVVFSTKLLGVSLLFWYALILTFVLWYVFESPAGAAPAVRRARARGRAALRRQGRARARAIADRLGRRRGLRRRALYRNARLRRSDLRASPSCCRLSRRRFSVRPRSIPDASTPGARSSRSSSCRPAFSASTSSAPTASCRTCSTAAASWSRCRFRNSCASGRRWTEPGEDLSGRYNDQAQSRRGACAPANSSSRPACTT